MDIQQYIGKDEWFHVMSLMPKDIEESALKLAIIRRREVGDASALLRICMAYGLCDMSLRQVAAWASAIGLGELSDVAVLKRLRRASDWLGHVMYQWMAERGLVSGLPGCRVRVVDASVISKPGSSGSDFRLHVGYDLAAQRITEVEVTDGSGGETFRRRRVNQGEVLIADRAYAHRQGIAHVLSHGGHVVVRAHWHNTGLESLQGKALDVVSLLETVGAGEVGDWPVRIQHDGQTYRLRLIAVRKSAAAAEREKKLMMREATRKERTVDPRALRAANFFAVLTDISFELLPAVQVLEMYRLRWQIEMVFKRLKSLLHIDHLRAKDSQLARTYLLAKIFGALIVEELAGKALSFFPWGYRLPAQTPEPLAGLCAVG